MSYWDGGNKAKGKGKSNSNNTNNTNNNSAASETPTVSSQACQLKYTFKGGQSQILQLQPSTAAALFVKYAMSNEKHWAWSCDYSERELLKFRALSETTFDCKYLYRRMNIVEYHNCASIVKMKKTYSFSSSFEKTDTDSYALYFSTSCMKCEQFQNKNVDANAKKTATAVEPLGDDEVIVKFEFLPSFLSSIDKLFAPGQESGAQGNKNAILIHREGFLACYSDYSSNTKTAAHLAEIKMHSLNFNIGFKQAHLATLNSALRDFTVEEGGTNSDKVESAAKGTPNDEKSKMPNTGPQTYSLSPIPNNNSAAAKKQ